MPAPDLIREARHRLRRNQRPFGTGIDDELHGLAVQRARYKQYAMIKPDRQHRGTLHPAGLRSGR
jgi:hypothetical protein